MTLPDHTDGSNASQVGEQLRSVINRGATVLIADMTATVACDHAGAGALVHAGQRAAVAGTQLRLVVTVQAIRRVLALSGLDRLIPRVEDFPSGTDVLWYRKRLNPPQFPPSREQFRSGKPSG